MTRTQAEQRLKETFGIDHFYDEQWKAIDALLHGERILMIERTGFGKSLCYQFPATLFPGVTVVFSPLIALMRDQVASLERKGIPARCINSEEASEDNDAAINDALNGRVKILYIAPERQENSAWTEAVKQIKLSMVVVDEAHTISQWGHDFRPAFRRIKNLVRNYLPQDMPILATTATATERVQKDIEEQLGGHLTTIRGNLMRENFRLHVINVNSEDEKMIWLKHNIMGLPGTGVIYAGTHVQTELYTKWLTRQGIDAIEYNAALDSDSRKEIERKLMDNEVKCVVSTNALGMGIDKPDIRFVIHLQIPQSPIHYYQEIGRAGRDSKPTDIILFFNSTKNEKGVMADEELPRAFIENGRPSEKKYRRFIDAVKEESLTEKGLMMKTNMPQKSVRVIREDLIEQGIIKEVVIGKRKSYEYQFNAPELDYERFNTLNEAKKKDLENMIRYVYTKEPRMKYLCSYLGDDTSCDFTNTCDNTGLPKYHVDVTDDDEKDIREFRDNLFPLLEFKTRYNLITGIAGSYYGESTVGNAIHRCKYENGGDFPDFLLTRTLRAYYHLFGNKKFDMIVYLPSTVSGDLVKNFAYKIARALKTPISDGLIKTRQTEPQKIFQQRYGKEENVKDAFTYEPKEQVSGKSILLVDDIYDSGATIKEIGKMLTKLGAAEIAPLVIAKTVGGDIQ
jgi:ATP-dependent DNA helicase RecQ